MQPRELLNNVIRDQSDRDREAPRFVALWCYERGAIIVLLDAQRCPFGLRACVRKPRGYWGCIWMLKMYITGLANDKNVQCPLAVAWSP